MNSGGVTQKIAVLSARKERGLLSAATGLALNRLTSFGVLEADAMLLSIREICSFLSIADSLGAY